MIVYLVTDHDLMNTWNGYVATKKEAEKMASYCNEPSITKLNLASKSDVVFQLNIACGN